MLIQKRRVSGDWPDKFLGGRFPVTLETLISRSCGFVALAQATNHDIGLFLEMTGLVRPPERLAGPAGSPARSARHSHGGTGRAAAARAPRCGRIARTCRETWWA